MTDKRFSNSIDSDTLGGVLLILATLIAMVLANSAFSEEYREILRLPVMVQIGLFEIAKPLFLWVNDGLMALFFLTVGLEIKREFLMGHLSRAEHVVLPAVAALLGVAAPAIIFVLLNHSDELAIRGWAIPTATDIAFAVGIFGLVGRHLPPSLKLFLMAVAIFDDIAAILIIALFYSGKLSPFSLVVAALGIIGLLALNRFQVRRVSFYILIGLVVWAAVLKSGVHATLAGFVLAWFIPLKLRDPFNRPMLLALEQNLRPWVGFFILPFFAFVNAGVDVRGIGWSALTTPVTLGIIIGLFLGKQLGIMAGAWVCIKANLASLPEKSSWAEFYGVSVLAGIGFTMSLFIGSLAFESDTTGMDDRVKLGVLTGSLLSAALGVLIIKITRRRDA